METLCSINSSSFAHFLQILCSIGISVNQVPVNLFRCHSTHRKVTVVLHTGINGEGGGSLFFVLNDYEKKRNYKALGELLHIKPPNKIFSKMSMRNLLS